MATQAYSDFMSVAFGGDVPEYPLTIFQIAARAGAVYLIGVILVRAGKSRLISRATPLDIILGFILGSLLSRGITGHASITDTAVASATLIAVHWLFTGLAFRSRLVGKLIKGHSYKLVEDGKVCEKNMLRAHVSRNDLEEAMRLRGIRDIADVEVATKERNGEVSFVGRQKSG